MKKGDQTLKSLQDENKEMKQCILELNRLSHHGCFCCLSLFRSFGSAVTQSIPQQKLQQVQ